MVEAVAVKKSVVRPWVRPALGLALSLAGVGVAMAATGGPFGAISNFVQTNFMPFIGSVGIAGGIGYAGIHAFKHDYGKAGVGVGTAAGGGFLINQYGWFGQQAGISAATLGGHLSPGGALAHLAVLRHAFGL